MSAPLWTLDAMAAAMRATVQGAPAQAITGLSIDSRTITPGDAYFAIKGDVHDGHAFVNAALKAAADGPMKGILQFEEEELVSVDFRGNPHSSIVDAGYTRVVGTNCVQVLSWYDNEWGYSSRCRDLIKFLSK